MTERRPLILRADTAPPRLQELPAGDLLPADTLGNALKLLLQGLVTGNNAGITPADTVLQALGKLQAQASAKVDKDGAKVLSDNNFTNDERVKLANIQASATKNLADAVLLDRSSHTGGFNGFGAANLMRNHDALPLTAPPSAYFGKGSFVGFAMGVEAGISGMSYGIGRVDAHWGDPTSGYGVMRSFEGGGGRRFTSYAVDANTWSDWFETSKRSNLQGMQGMDTVEGLGNALDAALRVRVVTPKDMKDFFNYIWNLGPGYYRNDTPGLDIPQYSAGFFSRTSDTWTFICAGYSNGVPVVFSGGYPDIATGNWFRFTFGNAASRNAQSNALDNTLGSLMAVGAFGLGILNAAGGINLDDASYFPTGLSHQYQNGAINGPYPDFYGYLTVEKVSNLYMIQTAKVVGSGVTYRRVFNNGVKGPWIPITDSQTAVGLIDNGAIIEQGSNANGSYVKFANGTMFVTWEVTGYSAGANYYNFPASFVGNPVPSIGVIAAGSWATPVGVYAWSGQLVINMAVADTLNILQMSAIGRWK